MVRRPAHPSRRGPAVMSTVLLLLLLLLVLCRSSVDAAAAAADVAAASPESLVLHTSLLELLTAEGAHWTVALGTIDAADSAATWTKMRDVRVEAQSAEPTASLLFTLPPPTNFYYGTAEPDDEADADDGRHDTDVHTVAQRRRLFGHPSLSFHGLSCEEYRAPRRGQQQHQQRQSVVQGRCFFLRDDGTEFFARYEVDSAGAAAADADGEAATQRRRRGLAHLAADGADDAVAAAPSATGSQVRHSTSSSAAWTEHISVSGGGAAGSEEHHRMGDISIDEYIHEGPDKRRSKHVVLTFAIVAAPRSGSAGWTAADGGSSYATHLRLEYMSGAFFEDMLRRDSGAAKALHTSAFRRWVWPALFVVALYAVLAAVARLVAWQKASAAGGSAAAGGGAGKPASTKKQQ
ncbi:hypothetical protein NESM_000649300 [Novymonas esmeraldas]|uniref:Uncharacterized protein n=1 Tax=Novymonas esmeraldas TaxID=1808958 RepID=A0AAW0ESD3_9TRYP